MRDRSSPAPWRLVASAVLAAACVSLAAASAGRGAQGTEWRQFVQAPGVFDVVGPRADGRFLVATSGGALLLRRNGSSTPFARGPGGYVPARGEAYVALAQKRAVPRARCSFRRDDAYALDPVDHPGIVLVDRVGRARRFAELPAGSFLSSIAFDSVGRFGYRLLVTTVVSDRTILYAIDCRGRARAVVRNAAKVEGGSAVAPRTFGRFAGWLVAADETSGNVYAFSPRGAVRLVARSGLPYGSDIGVESVGFVPAGLTRRGGALIADLGAPGSPTVGTDSVLRLSASVLRGARVRAGDLLVVAEARGTTIAVRCGRRCTVRRIGEALAATHAEGHISFVR